MSHPPGFASIQLPGRFDHSKSTRRRAQPRSGGMESGELGHGVITHGITWRFQWENQRTMWKHMGNTAVKTFLKLSEL